MKAVDLEEKMGEKGILGKGNYMTKDTEVEKSKAMFRAGGGLEKKETVWLELKTHRSPGATWQELRQGEESGHFQQKGLKPEGVTRSETYQPIQLRDQKQGPLKPWRLRRWVRPCTQG